MPDPATIIATVIPIAGAAIQSSKALFELVDDLRGGPEEIQSISTDAHSFYSIINSLKALLEDASIGEVIGGDDNMLNMIRNLTNPLSNCEAVLAKLTIKIQKHSRLDSDSRGDRMSVRVRWCLLTKKEVRDLQLRLGAAKSTLNSALNVISVRCGLRLLAMGKTITAPSVDSFNRPTDSSFAIRRFVEESIHVMPNPQAPSQTAADFDQETQRTIVSENRLPNRCLAHIYRALAENRILIQQLKVAIESRESRDERLSVAPHTDLYVPSNSMSSDLEHGFADLESSASDIFFDSISRFSVDPASSVDGSYTTIFSSPGGYFENSSSFYPEQYTMDGLFSDPIFVLGIIRSENDYQNQTYFLLYSETPRRWRRIIVSATFDKIQEPSDILGVSALDNLEMTCKLLPWVVWIQLKMLLPGLGLFNSATNLRLSFKGNESGQIISDPTATRINEDLLEVEMSDEDRILNDIKHLGCAKFLESDIIVQSRISSSCFKVRVQSRTCIERKVPFVNSGTQGENGVRAYLSDLKLLKSIQGCSGVADFVGVVLDDTSSHLRSYIYEFPVLGDVYTIFMCAQSKSEVVPWHIRESWARQIIKAVSEIHSKGCLVGGLRWLRDIGIREDGTAVLTGLRTSPRHFEDIPGHMPPESRDAAQTNTNTLEMVEFWTEIFQLGLILWKLAEHKANAMPGYFCSKSGCTYSPRLMCTADHTNPVELPTCTNGIPSYFNDIISRCRLPDPMKRPTACELAKELPPRSDDDQPAPDGLKDLLKRYAHPQSVYVHCNGCGTNVKNYYHCNICFRGSFDLCQACLDEGIHCYDPQHRLIKRLVKDDGIFDDSPE